MILSIQYLRFLAAVLVVFYHGTQSLANDLNSEIFETWKIGARGVDIFFVISGFIIVLVTERSQDTPAQFLARRLWRVAPIYYAATLAMLSVALAAPSLLASTRIEADHVIASFLFIPFDHPVAFSTFPLLPVGWTLNAEVQFYVFYASMLFLSPKFRVLSVTILIICVVLLGVLFQPDNATFSAWTAPTLIEFIFGMILGKLWYHLPIAKNPRLEIVLSLVVLFIGFSGLFLIPGELTSGVLQRDMRWLLAGVPAMAIVCGFLLLERQSIIPKIALLRLLGDASYSLYLCHFFVIGLMRALWPLDWKGFLFGEVGFLVSIVTLSLVGSLVLYILFERPVNQYRFFRMVK